MIARLKDLTFDRDGSQIVTLSVMGDFRNEYDRLKENDLDFELRKHREKRSLDANAYAWVLIGKIAERMHIGKVEVYRNAIRDIQGISTVGCVKSDQVDQMIKFWSSRGLGWQAETFESKLPGCTNVIFYAGSSQFDTDSMSELIDHLIQDAQSLGIETATPEEVRRMEERWGEKIVKEPVAD